MLNTNIKKKGGISYTPNLQQPFKKTRKGKSMKKLLIFLIVFSFVLISNVFAEMPREALAGNSNTNTSYTNCSSCNQESDGDYLWTKKGHPWDGENSNDPLNGPPNKKRISDIGQDHPWGGESPLNSPPGWIPVWDPCSSALRGIFWYRGSWSNALDCANAIKDGVGDLIF